MANIVILPKGVTVKCGGGTYKLTKDTVVLVISEQKSIKVKGIEAKDSL